VGLFYLLTLYSVIRGATAERPWRWYAAAIAACALGMGTKEVMATAPIVVLLHDRCFLSGSFREALRRRLPFYLGLAAMWGILGALLLAYPWGGGTGAGLGLPVGPWEYARTQPGVILHYLGLSFWPRSLCLCYAWPISETFREIAPASIVILLLLVGTGMLVQRLLMGFFWSSLFEMGRNIRTGAFDFILAQPGHPLFMASTRKLDPDGLANSFVAIAVVVYSAHRLGLHPTVFGIALYAGMVLAGLAIHYSILVLTMSLTFWLTSAQGVEGSYFTIVDFGRLPREAFRGISRLLFVWILPVVVVSNAPARIILHGFQASWLAWLCAVAIIWCALAVAVFNRGLRRYASASS